MTVFCTHCGAELSAESSHCTQCGSAVALTSAPTATNGSQPATRKKDRRWLWWVLALILFFALGFWLALLLAPKCPSCAVPPSDGAGNGRTARGSGSSEPENGRPDKTGGRPDQGPAESAGGGSNGDIEGSGKSTPHEFAGQVDSGNSHGHKTDDDDPALDNKGHGGTGDQELYGAVAQLAQGVAPYGSAETSSQDNTAAHTKSWVAYDFTYDKSELPRYPDNVQEVASSISYALDAKTREQTGTFATGAGIVTTSRFDDVVDWYRKNLPAGWQSSSIGDFGQLAQATQGPGGDLMKLLKGEMPGAAPTSGSAKPAIPKVRVALFKAPTTHAGSPDSTIMILQKDDKPVSVYLQTASK